MPSTVFTALLDEKIRSFIAAYDETSRHVFYDDATKRLRHTGEFGAYRESIVREFLRFFIPGRIDIHTGFLITATDAVSTQCDIVAYDAKNTPLIESGERQRFFPVESVCAIGEVKSALSKDELKVALNKLARIKAMREEIPSPTVIRRERQGGFDPQNYGYDQLPTFLICQRFDFDHTTLADDVEAFYDADIPRRHRHNMVLSLHDGLLLYADSNGKSMMFPELSGRLVGGTLTGHEIHRNRIVKPSTGSYGHLRLFCSYIFLLTSSVTILYPDITSYMQYGGDTLIEQTGT